MTNTNVVAGGATGNSDTVRSLDDPNSCNRRRGLLEVVLSRR